MEVYDRKIRALPDVIAGLTGCIVGNCSNCEYTSDDGCGRDDLMIDALFWLKELRTDNERLRERLSILRAELAEERERSARWVRESEPVVHAHWEGDWCSSCGELSEQCYPRCPYCGAHMDEEVAE